MRLALRFILLVLTMSSLASRASASYVYDPGSGSGAGAKTIYQVFSRVTGGLVYRDEVTDGETTDYASVGGAALRLKKAGATLTPEYTHFDHQGSGVAATDASGAILWRESYEPFGRTRLNPAANANDTGYTGHLRDAASGLIYMQARYMDPLIGRFYSTDPIGYEDQLNLYAYVGNDPVNKVDPNGQRSSDELPGGILRACPPGEDVQCRNHGRGTLTSNRNERGNLIFNTVPNDDPSLGKPLMSTEQTAAIAGMIFPNAIGLAGSGVTARISAVGSLLGSRSAAATSGINITERGLTHVIDRHSANGALTAGKSVFNASENIVGLIRGSGGASRIQQAGGNFERVIGAGRIIGFDRVTGQPTSVYTVITNQADDLVTAFPGRP